MNTQRSLWRHSLAALLIIAGAGLYASGRVSTLSEDAVTQPELRCGWTPAATEADRLIAEMAQPLVIEGLPPGATSEGAVVKLWDFEKQVNDGQPLPALRQETGDCTSFGGAGVINTLQCVQIARGAPIEFHQAFPPYLYGMSRVAPDIGNGALGRSAGAVGRWTAEAALKYGVLRADAPGVPEYSGKLADSWGYKGVPQEFQDEAEPFKIGSYARIRTYEEGRDAIALAGTPFTIASDVGFRMQQEIANGRRWGKRSGSWSHQMHIKACDDTVTCPDGSKGAFYLMNSWGASAHSPPADDAPAGGFWISRKDFEYMVNRPNAEAYAYSMFTGFPYQPLNIHIFQDAPRERIHFVKQGPGEKYLSEFAGLSRLEGQFAGVVTLAGAGLLLLLTHRRKQGISRTTAA